MKDTWEYLRIACRSHVDWETGKLRARTNAWIHGKDIAEQREVSILPPVELLNEFGAEGWELVAEHAAGNVAFPATDDNPATSHPVEIVWTLKRRAVG